MNDNVYVVWQNAEEAFADDVTVDVVASKIGLSVSKYAIESDSFSPVQSLTNSSDGLDVHVNMWSFRFKCGYDLGQ